MKASSSICKLQQNPFKTFPKISLVKKTNPHGRVQLPPPPQQEQLQQPELTQLGQRVGLQPGRASPYCKVIQP